MNWRTPKFSIRKCACQDGKQSGWQALKTFLMFCLSDQEIPGRFANVNGDAGRAGTTLDASNLELLTWENEKTVKIDR